MKNLFTFPNNSGTYYVDPAHIGDGTYGVSYRVDELLKGNYRDYFGATPFYQHGTTWQDTAPIFSKYINYCWSHHRSSLYFNSFSCFQRIEFAINN